MEDTGGGHSDPRKTPTGKLAKGHAKRQDRDHNEGDGNTKTPTEARLAKEDAKTRTGVLKTFTGTLYGQEDNSTKTHTEVHAKDRDEGDDNTKNLTGMLGVRKHNEGDANTAKNPTGVLKTHTRTHGARDHDKGDDSTKTFTGLHLAKVDANTKSLTGTAAKGHGEVDSSTGTKTLTGVHARDHNEGEADTKTLTGVPKNLPGQGCI